MRKLVAIVIVALIMSGCIPGITKIEKITKIYHVQCYNYGNMIFDDTLRYIVEVYPDGNVRRVFGWYRLKEDLLVILPNDCIKAEIGNAG